MFLFELGKKFVVCYGHYLCVHAKCNFAIDKKKNTFWPVFIGCRQCFKKKNTVYRISERFLLRFNV